MVLFREVLTVSMLRAAVPPVLQEKSFAEGLFVKVTDPEI